MTSVSAASCQPMTPSRLLSLGLSAFAIGVLLFTWSQRSAVREPPQRPSNVSAQAGVADDGQRKQPETRLRQEDAAAVSESPQRPSGASTQFQAVGGGHRAQFETWLRQAETAVEKRDYDLALSCLTAALDLDPQSADVHTRRAEVYMFSGQPRLALADWNEAMRLDPSHKLKLYCLMCRADCHLKLRNHAEAIKDCSDVLRMGDHISKFYCI